MKSANEQSMLRETWRRFKKNKASVVGLAIVVIFCLMAIFADVIVDYDTYAIKQNISEQLQKPSTEHIMGTDNFGRDVFARIVHGSRYSLIIGLGTTLISMLVGGTLGAITGFYQGRIDTIIMRLLDAVMSIPEVLLALAIVSALGGGLGNLMIAITVAQIPNFTRVVRSTVITLHDADYIRVARSCGANDAYIIVHHIIPNAIGPILVQATQQIAMMILSAAGLSFLGLGVPAPSPEWGTMLSEGKEFIRTAPYLLVFPGVSIVLCALSFNLLGDGLRDALDPKLKD